MKLPKLVYLLIVGAALSSTVIGCRKGLDKTTKIPGSSGNASIGDPGAAGPRGDLGPGQGTTTPQPTGDTGPIGAAIKDSNIAASKSNLDDWIPNRDEFRAQTVYFDFDKSNIKPGEVKKLEEVARRMKSNFQGKAVRIEGHCDERGTEEYNRALGDRRAFSIREKLVQLGLDPEMVPTISFGEEKPADPGHNDEAFRKNRRGEFILLSPPGGG